MKTNLLKSVSILFAVAAIMAGCSQDEALNNVQEQEQTPQTVKVIVNTSDFNGVDAESRAVEDVTSHTTNFTNGDKIGVYIVDAQGNLTGDNQNIALTYTVADGATTGTWNGTLDYVADAKYMAYFPYSETAVTSTSAITNTITADQSDATKYYANDLMIADAVSPTESGDGYTIALTFKHQNAMIEFSVPYSKESYYYYTGAEDTDANKVEFSFTDGVAEGDITFKIGETTYNLYKVEGVEGIYRCIVTPSQATTFTISLVHDGSTVNFPETSITLSANTYKRYNLTWDGAPTASTSTEAQKYTFEAGDYYYADGSVYPKAKAADATDVSTHPTTGAACVGVVFHTTTTDTDKASGWRNAYVIGLTNVQKPSTTDGVTTIGYEYKWYDSAKATSKDDLKIGDTADLDGYTDWTSKKDETAYDAFSNITAERYPVTLPSFASAWYLPSAGQMAAFADNLAQNNEDLTPDGYQNEQACTETYTYLTTLFEKAGGKFYAQVKNNTTNDCWWTSNWGVKTKTDGTTEDNAIALSIGYGTDDNHKKIGLIYRGFTQTGGCIRPVFAF